MRGTAPRQILFAGGEEMDAAVESIPGVANAAGVMRIAAETQLVTVGDLNADGIIKLSAGKKRHALVRVI